MDKNVLWWEDPLRRLGMLGAFLILLSQLLRATGHVTAGDWLSLIAVFMIFCVAIAGWIRRNRQPRS
jgi:hypothetical protein